MSDSKAAGGQGHLISVVYADGQLLHSGSTEPEAIPNSFNISAQPTVSVSTQEVIGKFLTAVKHSVNPATIVSYRATLRVFAKHCPILLTAPEGIEKYLSRYKPDKPTARGAYVVIRLMYNFASKRLGVPNPMALVAKPRFKHKTPDRLTAIEAKRLLDAIKTAIERALVYCFLGLGLRLSEAQRLNVEDIGEDTILVHGKERDEPMPLLPEIRDALLQLADGKPGGAVFQGQRGRLSVDMIGYIIKKLFIRAGINGVKQSPHTLRHSRGALTAAAGLDSLSSKRLLRHRSTAMTDLYSQLNLDELRAKEERFNPIRLLANLNTEPTFGKILSLSECQADTTELLSQLLDQLEIIGETAKQLKQALGSNGHRTEAVKEIREYLQHQASK